MPVRVFDADEEAKFFPEGTKLVKTLSTKSEIELIYLCSVGKSMASLARCLENKPDINYQQETGATPLMLACSAWSVPFVKTLLAEQADVNLKDSFGSTALSIVNDSILLWQDKKEVERKAARMRRLEMEATGALSFDRSNVEELEPYKSIPNLFEIKGLLEKAGAQANPDSGRPDLGYLDAGQRRTAPAAQEKSSAGNTTGKQQTGSVRGSISRISASRASVVESARVSVLTEVDDGHDPFFEEHEEPQFQRQLTPPEERQRNQRFLSLVHAISKMPLFTGLDPSEFPKVAEAFRERTFKEGEAVLERQSGEHNVYVIADGEASSFCRQVSDESVPEDNSSDPFAGNCMSPGDYFGERSFRRENETATVHAMTDLTVYVLSRRAFDKLDINRKALHWRRKAVHGGHEADQSPRQGSKGKDRSKTDQERIFLKKAIAFHDKLSTLLSDLDDDELNIITEQAASLRCDAGTAVIKQGDVKADHFYVIAEGTFDVFINDKHVGGLGEADIFGELALLYRAPRAATVRSTSAAKLWEIHRRTLRKAFEKPMKRKLEAYANLLRQVELFNAKSAGELSMIADALVESTHYKGEYIITQGEKGDSFFVLYDGEVRVDVDSKEVARLVGNPEENAAQFFGERALLNNEPRGASIIVESEKAKVLILNHETFLAVLKPPDETSPKRREGYIEYSRTNLEEIGILGAGGFGTVSLVKDKITGQTLALKALAKGHIMNHDAKSMILNEKVILRITGSPFLIRLAATFNSPEYLYFLMEPALGGDLITMYERHEYHGSEVHAKFYSACVMRAIEHLHSRHVCHRDLKPENLLIDAKGYCKVTDFGLSKFVLGHTYTTCGTPEFFAPEVISGGGYTKAVDWWALGALIFEFMVGRSPFRSPDQMKVLTKIKKGVIRYPRTTSPWTDLVQGLCKMEASERLPIRKGGVRNVEEHPWFVQDGFDWAAFNHRTMVPPFVPTVTSSEDISNFEAVNKEMPASTPYVDPGTGWDDDFEDPWGPSSFQ